MVEYVTAWGTRLSEEMFRNLGVEEGGFDVIRRQFEILSLQDVRTTMVYVGRRRDGSWSVSMIGIVDDGTLMFDWWTNKHRWYHYHPTLTDRFEKSLRRHRLR